MGQVSPALRIQILLSHLLNIKEMQKLDVPREYLHLKELRPKLHLHQLFGS